MGGFLTFLALCEIVHTDEVKNSANSCFYYSSKMLIGDAQEGV